MAVLFTNNASGRLAGSISTSQTTLSLQSGQGARFPNPSGGDWFPLTVVRANGDMEIMRVTGRSNDLLTVTRAQESTPGREFEAGDRAELRVTAGAIQQIKTDAFPTGGIIRWSGSIATIPDAWALCDGTQGTPDLRDKFVPGAGGAYAVGQTGGADSVTLTTSQIPSHSHSGSSGNAGTHNHSGNTGSNGSHDHTGSTGNNGGHSHTGSTNTTGSHSHSGSASSAGSHSHSTSTRTGVSGGASSPPSLYRTSSNISNTNAVNVNSGGAHTHSLSINNNGSHSHSFTTASVSDHAHSISSDGAHTHTIGNDGSHNHSVSIGNTGGGGSHENRPSFYALAYIMKL